MEDDIDQQDMDDASWDQHQQELHRHFIEARKAELQSQGAFAERVRGLETEAIKADQKHRHEFDARMWEWAFEHMFRS